MGIFDGYLLMSDIDGTFEKATSYPRPEINVAAVDHFTKNGGRFAFATGRLADHLVERRLSELTNAPCCICNGSYVYDYEKETVLFSRHLPFTVAEFFEYFKPFIPHSRLLSLVVDIKTAESFNLKNCELPRGLLDKKCAKIVATMDTEENADMLERALLSLPFFSDTLICKSWKFGVEVLPGDGTKGDAIKFIKEYCGAHTSVGIGDYGNDLPLITHADIGVAVGDAVQSLRDAADLVVCECDCGAVSDLIYKLEQKIKYEL